MKYIVSLRPGHPRGIYRRSGREFTREGQAPLGVSLTEDEMTEEILNDPWLIVDEAEHEGPGWPTGAQELIEHIEGLGDGSAVDAIDEWERTNKKRKSVLEATDARLTELADPGDGVDD